jgi:spore coat protein U-like protein
MTRIALIALAGSVAAAALSGGASALTTTTTFNVTATVQAACTVGATNMAFPTYTAQVSTVGGSGAQVNQTSTITVTCSSGAPYTIALNDGGNASSGQRRMSNGATTASYLNYELYNDTNRTARWGATAGTMGGTGSGAGQDYTIYGAILPSQAVPPGNYADVITVTLTY